MQSMSLKFRQLWVRGALLGLLYGGGLEVMADPGPTEVEATRFVVKSSPSSAEVRVDGSLKGLTPLFVEVSPGTHTVQVGSKGYGSVNLAYDVEAGQTRPINVDLERSGPKGPVRLVGPPEMKGARVFQQGKKIGNIPVSTELAAGVYDFQVVGESFYKVHREVVLSSDGSVVTIDLTHH